MAAVEHRGPDHVPINFGGETCAGIVKSVPGGRVYTRLCQSLGIWDRIHHRRTSSLHSEQPESTAFTHDRTEAFLQKSLRDIRAKGSRVIERKRRGV
ncbi:MAG: hypothetical protein AMS17_14675 [Spirochaetes bacterium DG_61]|nr:MAG: hypothetical protein AMS17_14675 [Spirochaetes bacterium DG_61]